MPPRSKSTLLLTSFALLTLAQLFATPNLLNYTFPAFAFLLATYLFRRSKSAYLAFTIALWYSAGLLRRLADFRGSFHESSPILLAPYFAAAVSGTYLFTRSRTLITRQALPFTCTLAAVLFGSFVGLLLSPPAGIAKALIQWIPPILFAFFLYEERAQLPALQHTIQRSFLYGTLFTALYGIIQFFLLPPWDEQWMRDTHLGSFGLPERLEVRVFSTFGSPASCAVAMMVGLLLLTATPTRLKLLAIPTALLTLALTVSRTSWIGLVFGILALALQLPNRARVRLLAGLLFAAVLVPFALQIPALDALVTTRLQSFTDPNKDASYLARLEGHRLGFAHILTQPLGEGLGGSEANHSIATDDDAIGPHDSTVLETLYSLGFLGAALYALGLLAAAFQIIRHRTTDPFQITLRATLLACLSEIILNSMLIGWHGFVVWLCLGLTLAAAQKRVLRNSL